MTRWNPPLSESPNIARGGPGSPIVVEHTRHFPFTHVLGPAQAVAQSPQCPLSL